MQRQSKIILGSILATVCLLNFIPIGFILNKKFVESPWVQKFHEIEIISRVESLHLGWLVLALIVLFIVWYFAINLIFSNTED